MTELGGDGGEAVLCVFERVFELRSFVGGLCEQSVLVPFDLRFGAGFEGSGEALECGDAVGVGVMQQPDISVECVALCGEVLDECVPILRFGRGGQFERLSELREDLGLAGLVGVQFQAEWPHSQFVQSVLDDFERGLLLGDEEHSASEREVVADEVRDGLGLAGSGGAVEDEGLSERGI